MNYARLNYACLLVLAMGGCLLEDRSLCPGDYMEGGSQRALDCQWDFCRRNPEHSRCVDAGAPDGSGDAAADGAGDGDAGCQLDCPCTRDEQCPAELPVCEASSGLCIECSISDDGLCTSQGKVCLDGGDSCVECNDRKDCDEGAPHCNADNTCGQCVSNEDCGRWGKVCDAGQCVQCTPATEMTQCPDADPAPGDQGPACDPVAKTCTGQLRGSVSGCGACVSDSECVDGAACVQTTFKGAAHGAFCLAEVASASDVCPQQTNKNRAAVSVLGHAGQFCFPDTLTTCEAILDFGTGGCGTDDSACGADGLADGLCRSNKCTYVCGAADDCFGSTSMDNRCVGAGTKYCNPN